ncbi:hypothetical protein MHY1_p00178 (plasmid) [Methylovirgula sp. HY1]|nr:hypothetical protein MHY1_p00178 [Methylovirgula sp. HY1]
MSTNQINWRPIVTWLLISIPLGGLALNALSWLIYGTDLPFLDDWSDYYFQTATSFSLAHLFAKGNDTIFPIGRALDVFAQIVLHGNSIAYQFISMICVLGFFLFIQWRLLCSTFNNRLIAASLFCFSIFMLEPYTYWGLQNNAYIQAIPFMGVMATIYVFIYIFNRRDGGPWWVIPSVFMLGLVTGLAYVSGPLIEIAVAIVFFCTTLLRRDPERRIPILIRAGLALLAAAIGTAILQIGVILFLQKGALHRPDAHWTFPNDWDYWFFMLGKVGRALALQNLSPPLSITLVAVIVLATAAMFIWHAQRAYRGLLTEDREMRVALIFCSVVAANFVYLNEVSAGRARLRPPSVDTAMEVFAFGFQNRFHFFPLTLLWPWLAAGMLHLLLKFDWFSRRDYLIAPAALVVVGLATFGGVLDNASDYRSIAAMRAGDITCIQSQIMKGHGINCPKVWPTDLSKALVYARSLGSSFTKYLPIVPFPIGTNNPPPLFRLSNLHSTVLTPYNATSSGHTLQEWKFVSTNEDPQILFKTGADNMLRHCLMVQVAALVHAEKSDFAELFFKTPGQRYFTEASSRTQKFQIEGPSFVEVEFNLVSESGFADKFRLDVVQSKQPFQIREIEIRCRLSDGINLVQAAKLKRGSQR